MIGTTVELLLAIGSPLVPRWFRSASDEPPEDLDDRRPPPPLRPALPALDFPRQLDAPPQLAASASVDPVAIMRTATALVEKYERENAGGRRREEELKISLTEETLAHEATKKKVDYLELENAELRNNLQTLQAQVEDYRRFLSKIRELLDFFNIEKRTRNNNGKKKAAAAAAAQTPTETAQPEPKQEEAPCETPSPPAPSPSQ
jgi:hypothetical protein